MGHTKGPWIVMPGAKAPRICVEGDKDWPIVIKISGHSDEAIIANEKLIAAAPEMLEALEWLSKNNWEKFTVNNQMKFSSLIKKREANHERQRIKSHENPRASHCIRMRPD